MEQQSLQSLQPRLIEEIQGQKHISVTVEEARQAFLPGVIAAIGSTTSCTITLELINKLVRVCGYEEGSVKEAIERLDTIEDSFVGCRQWLSPSRHFWPY